MKRFPKKVLGILLTVVMIATMFSILPANAANTLGDKAKGTSTVMDFEGFTGNYTEKDANTVMGMTDNLTQENANVTISLATRKIADNTADAVEKWNYATKPAMLDGKAAGTAVECVYITGFNKVLENNNGTIRSANTSKEYAVDVVVDLGAEANVTGVLVASCLGGTKDCAIGDYDMYASTSSNVFAGTLIGQYVVDKDYWASNTVGANSAERGSLGLEAWKTKNGSTITARYIGLRIYVTNTAFNRTTACYFDRIRLNEIAVYGEYNEEPEGDGYYIVKGTSEKMKFTNVAASYNANKNANTVIGLSEGDNLTQGNSNVSFNFVTTNVSDTSQSKTHDKSVDYNTTTYAAMVDGVCGGKAEMPANYGAGFINSQYSNNHSIMALYDANTSKYTPNTSKKYAIDITVDLGQSADISGVLISASYQGLIGDYELFASNDSSTLFSGTAIGEYKVNLDYFLSTERTDAQRKDYGINIWKTKSGQEITARYVGFRIYMTNISMPSNSAYYYHDRLRLNEIAVWGKYDIPYHNYSVTSTHGSLNITGNTWQGRELTFEAPAITGAYLFKNWTVNGNVVAGTRSEDGTKFSISTTITDSANQIVAVYEIAQLDITTDVYTIDRTNKILYLPSGTFGVTALNNFDNFKDILVVKRKDGTIASANERMVTGMDIRVDVEGGEKLDIITIGDSTLDGDLSVTDLVKTTSAVLGGTIAAKEQIAADANHNGVLTVTDVVIARNDLLADATLDSYTQKTVTLNQIDYKIVGRRIVDNEGTASETATLNRSANGFVFNVNAVGEVYLNVSGPSADYVTVTVDGKEYDRPLGVSSGNTLVAEGLEPGIHEIGIHTQKEGQTVKVLGATFCGEAVETEDDDFLIEFIGDSISAAYGNLFDRTAGVAFNNQRHQNAFWGYGPIVGRTLGVNYSLIATSGSVLIDDPACSNSSTMQKEYLTKYRNNTSSQYDFANNQKADITCISLGANDCKVLPYMFNTEAEQVEFFKNQAMTFARTIVSKNGPNAKIVFWQSGGLDYATYRATNYASSEGKAIEGYNSIRKAYTKAVEELAKEGITAYLAPDTPCDVNGLYVHPLIEGKGGHKDIAARLVTFLREEVLDD